MFFFSPIAIAATVGAQYIGRLEKLKKKLDDGVITKEQYHSDYDQLRKNFKEIQDIIFPLK